MKNLQPTTDRVVILPVLEEEESAGLEIVRDHRNTEMQVGLVVAAGPQSTIPKGTKVMYNPAAGTLVRRLNEDGTWEDLRIMHSDTIQCIIL